MRPLEAFLLVVSFVASLSLSGHLTTYVRTFTVPRLISFLFISITYKLLLLRGPATVQFCCAVCIPILSGPCGAGEVGMERLGKEVSFTLHLNFAFLR